MYQLEQAPWKCEECGEDIWYEDDAYTIITYPHGVNRGMRDKTVCVDCYEKQENKNELQTENTKI